MKIWTESQEITAAYHHRSEAREINLMTATMNFVMYFILLDNSADDDATKKLNAEDKVSQISTEVSLHLYPYRLGNTQPLIDAVNNSALSFMDAAAKTKLTTDLSI